MGFEPETSAITLQHSTTYEHQMCQGLPTTKAQQYMAMSKN